MFELPKIAVGKNLIVFKVFLKKVLELLLYHWIVGFKATLLLMILLNYCSIEKLSGKKNLI